MALQPLNSVAGFSTGDPAITVIQANADINTVNLTANGLSNLGAVSNLKLSGGSNGQFLKTDGSGNLSFASISTTSISNGNSNVNIPSANGNVNISSGGTANVFVVTANGINVTGTSNLGANGNVTITGGSNNQVLTTDGSGNLSWSTVSVSQSAAPMPIVIDAGNTLTIQANYQGLFGTPLIVEGTLEVDGVLIDVSGQGAAGTDTQVTFNDAGTPSGNNGFTFSKTSGNLAIPGSINTGSFVRLAAYSKSELNAITGVIGQIAVLNNSSPVGMMAFWDGTNNRWSYVHDNSAVV